MQQPTKQWCRWGGRALEMRYANGRNAWGRTCTHRFVRQIERQTNKNREGDGALQFNGSCWMGGHNNQPKVSLVVGIYLGETARRVAAIGEDAVKSFWPYRISGKKMNIPKFVVALGGRQSLTARNNQP
jgi:hypothetical protein